jgi:hypothetical protein
MIKEIARIASGRGIEWLLYHRELVLVQARQKVEILFQIVASVAVNVEHNRRGEALAYCVEHFGVLLTAIQQKASAVITIVYHHKSTN